MTVSASADAGNSPRAPYTRGMPVIKQVTVGTSGDTVTVDSSLSLSHLALFANESDTTVRLFLQNDNSIGFPLFAGQYIPQPVTFYDNGSNADDTFVLRCTACGAGNTATVTIYLYKAKDQE